MCFLTNIPPVFFNWRPFAAILLIFVILAILCAIISGLHSLYVEGCYISKWHPTKGRLYIILSIVLFILFIASMAAMTYPIVNLFKLLGQWLD